MRLASVGTDTGKIEAAVVFAIRRLVIIALPAMSAIVVTEDDVIPDGEARDVFTKRIDDTCAFVTKNDWKRTESLALGHDVRMANAGGDNPDSYLIGGRRLEP